uniref:Mediator of RNA polymerase II transcription subunit 31 n=1 Tax=Meloidogyne hapla TaxID=6305 RepID=A0A1I8C1L6_MELHA
MPQQQPPPIMSSAALNIGSSMPGTSTNVNQFPSHLQAHLNQMSIPSSTATGMRLQETAEEARRRFEIECEFVQALANPHYLNYLAQKGYFKEDCFVNYLKYLLYFKWPAYSRTLKYPQCLFLLECLQYAEFREAIASTDNARYIEDQLLLQWHFYMRVRQRLQVFTFCYFLCLNDSATFTACPTIIERMED